MDNSRIPKKVLDWNFRGRRPVGRPRLRWEENIKRDFSLLLSIRGWRRLEGAREMWKRTTEVARARCGLSCHRGRRRRKMFVSYDFTIEIDYIFKLHEQIGLYNGDGVCLLWVRNWIFKCYLDEFRLQGLMSRWVKLFTAPVTSQSVTKALLWHPLLLRKRFVQR